MQKKVVLSVFVAVLIGGVLGLVWWLQEPLAPIARAADSAQVEPTDGGDRSAPIDDANPTATQQRSESAGDGAAHETPASPTTGDSLADGIEVLVRRKSDRKPLAGASVSWAGNDAHLELDQSFWAWLRTCSVDEKLAAVAKKVTTDEAGIARVPRARRDALIVASAGDLWGYAIWTPNSDAPVELDLTADADLAVQVVDTRKAPVAGALVVLRSRSGEWFDDRLVAATDREGRATLTHAGHLMRSFGVEFRPSWSVALAAVLSEVVEVAVDPAKLPEEAVCLVMPETGVLEVRALDEHGAPYTELIDVSLRALDADESTLDLDGYDWTRHGSLEHVRGGVARFTHVELGRAFEARVQRSGQEFEHRARDVGPTSAGQLATITVRLGEQTAVLAGRVLDVGGSPLARARVRGVLTYENAEDQHPFVLTTDGEGRFAFDTDVGDVEWSPRTLTISAVDERDAELASATRALPGVLHAGLHQLGDFALTESPVLVEGTVLDGAGAPVAGARVAASIRRVWDESDPDAFWWQPLDAQRALTGADGRFSVRGKVAVAQIGLTAEKRGASGGPVIVAPGERAAVIRMHATGELAGIVLLDPTVRREGLSMFANRSEPTEASAETWAPPVALDEQGNFVLRGLEPGRYTVTLSHTASWEALHEIEGVVVAGGAVSRDPRLDPLDLRGQLFGVQLRFVDVAGRPINEGSLMVSDAGGDGERRHAWFQNGVAELYHSGGGLDVQAACDGFRPATLLDVTSDREVTLRAAIAVRYHLAPGLKVPQAPVFLGVSLASVQAEAGGEPTWSWGEDHFDAQGQLRTKSAVVGRARVSLTVTVMREDFWTSSTFDDQTEREIEILDRDVEQAFAIGFDQAALDAFVQQLLASANEEAEDE